MKSKRNQTAPLWLGLSLPFCEIPLFQFSVSMAAKKNQSSTRSVKQRQRQAQRRGAMVFTRRNYVLLILGLAMIVVGYVIMRMENEVDGFISLYVAPLVLLAGYLEVIYAILWRPAKETPGETA